MINTKFSLEISVSCATLICFSYLTNKKQRQKKQQKCRQAQNVIQKRTFLKPKNRFWECFFYNGQKKMQNFPSVFRIRKM